MTDAKKEIKAQIRKMFGELNIVDVLDIVFFVISKQDDIEKIGEIETKEFYELLRVEWSYWVKSRKEKFPSLNYPWPSYKELEVNGIPVADSKEEIVITVKRYMRQHPGIIKFIKLITFYRCHSEKLKNMGWKNHNDKNIYTMKRLGKWAADPLTDEIFDFGGVICEEIRKKLAAKKNN
jgi:hypothetical protein